MIQIKNDRDESNEIPSEEPELKKAKLEEPSALSKVANRAAEALTKDGKSVLKLGEWKDRFFFFRFRQTDIEESPEIACVSGKDITMEQYAVIAAAQHKCGADDLDNSSFMESIVAWFQDPKVYVPHCENEAVGDEILDMECGNCPYDKSSYGCLYGKTVPYNPCQVYIVLSDLY